MKTFFLFFPVFPFLKPRLRNLKWLIEWTVFSCAICIALESSYIHDQMFMKVYQKSLSFALISTGRLRGFSWGFSCLGGYSWSIEINVTICCLPFVMPKSGLPRTPYRFLPRLHTCNMHDRTFSQQHRLPISMQNALDHIVHRLCCFTWGWRGLPKY